MVLAAAAVAPTAGWAPAVPPERTAGSAESARSVPSVPSAQERSCEGVGKGRRGFPVVARLRGPDAFRAGGVPEAWVLELTNRSARVCAGLHPVVVLTDERRSLLPSQAALFFFDGERPRAVDFEGTDRAELVGVFGDERRARKGDFDGFTVRAGETVRVRVLLSVAPDAAANEVTAEAVVVRRAGAGGADGEWVGRSQDPYRFRIRPAAAPAHGASGPSAARDAPFPWRPVTAATAAAGALAVAAAWTVRRVRRRRPVRPGAPSGERGNAGGGTWTGAGGA